MSQQGVVSVATRASDWWGTSLEFQAEVGENLENFKSGYLHFELEAMQMLALISVSKPGAIWMVIRSIALPHLGRAQLAR